VAELGQLPRVWNRPGNVNDSHNADGFLRSVVGELRQRFGRIALDVRLDGAFFVPRLLATSRDPRRHRPRSAPYRRRSS
jgi:hypothetical protein